VPIMKKSGSGSIVNISSMASLVGLPSASSAYTSSKGAVRSLTKNISTQYGPYNIRCNSVHPGFVETPMMTDVLSDTEGRQSRLAMTPLGIIATAYDIALSVLFLASDEASYITGAELVIDGGITAK
jgi:NAD(P)-dependent dehydrogenase (short-subunit alcohol dehydrogenase family)